ncbi:hypothetical protein ACQP00_19795 [Dactylosporangium sp. CS-047395]|uniref:hypothetical protein n=1 Tax=Dactylosporangium sp. CS-047395 TaxID=3239936 RepID=UPI003D8DC037
MADARQRCRIGVGQLIREGQQCAGRTVTVGATEAGCQHDAEGPHVRGVVDVVAHVAAEADCLGSDVRQ